MRTVPVWRDTALLVTTDHGFLLGEHDFWAKNRMNLYQEIVHIPLFFHYPDHAKADGTRRGTLTQTIDIAATFLDLFDVKPAPEMQGRSMLPLLADDKGGPEGLLFGYFGGAVNVTDGHYTYHRFPPDLHAQNIYQYTLTPHISSRHFRPRNSPPRAWPSPSPLPKACRCCACR